MSEFPDHRLGEFALAYLRTLPELRGVHLWLVDPADLEGELQTQAAEATTLAVRLEGPTYLTVDFSGERLLELTVRLRESLWHATPRNARGQLASLLAQRLRVFQPPGAPEPMRPHPFTPRAVPEPKGPWREEVLRYVVSLGYAAHE
ncbi:MAG: hypothetical protein Q7P63_12945 [Verrucomicrobiota bacterium JB022]|nr:hypothetical protein [Verrucomicrobiota bacterium JB022]